MRRAASIEKLLEIKDVDEGIAEKVRTTWRTVTDRGEARRRVDALIGTAGVEYLGQHKRTRKAIYYCNAGDSYATTVCFHGPNLVVACWADFVEGRKVQE